MREGRNTVCLGRAGSSVDVGSVGVAGIVNELWYSIMGNMFPGLLLDVMIVVTPAPVAISAAMILVSIPPVPRLEPKVVVLTVASISSKITDIENNLTLGPNL